MLRTAAPTVYRVKRSVQRRRAAARERGVAVILAMMFLVIFGSLAAAMAIVSQGNLRTSETQSKINRSLTAAESGLEMAMFRASQVTRGYNDPVTNAEVFPGIYTTMGLIGEQSAYNFWFVGDPSNDVPAMIEALAESFEDDGYDVQIVPTHTLSDGRVLADLVVGPIALGGNQPSFTITYRPHPFADPVEYEKPLYSQPPYDGSMPQTGIDFAVQNADGSVNRALDGRFVRVIVTGYDDGQGGLDPNVTGDPSTARGPEHAQVRRTVQMDFMLDKKIPFAILSRSRLMVGRSVIVDGPVGSRFNEPQVPNGHPIHMLSDFRGLEDELDDKLDAFYGWLSDPANGDRNGDNRIDVTSSEGTSPPAELAVANAGDLDYDRDGYVTDFDLFLDHFDANGPGDEGYGQVSESEFGVLDTVERTSHRAQLFDLLNQNSPFYNPLDPDADAHRVLDADDFYAKIRGEVSILTGKDQWESHLNGDSYRKYLEGSIVPGFGKQAFNTGSAGDLYEFTQHDFDIVPMLDASTISVSNPYARSVYALQNLVEKQTTDGTGSTPNGAETATYIAPSASTREGTPYMSSQPPADYYERPVFRNMYFKDAVIPKGTNALFENCTFEGTTFVEVETENDYEYYNYVGMQDISGVFMHYDYGVTIDGVEWGNIIYQEELDDPVNRARALGTKNLGNNLRFHNCTIVGRIVTGELDGNNPSLQPLNYTHVRNRLAFTGGTTFTLEGLPDDEVKEYQRSMLMAPHMSVEIGFFAGATEEEYAQQVSLSGVIVAGIIDIRGNADINGTVLTTYEPRSYDDDGNQSPQMPVRGPGSADFNTTLGYFDQSQGDMEGGLPAPGQSMGRVRLRYDGTIPLPDGILGPITFRSIPSTYAENVK